MTLKLALVGLLVGSTALGLATSAASGRGMSSARAGAGAVTVHHGHGTRLMFGQQHFGRTHHGGLPLPHGRSWRGNWNDWGNGHGGGHDGGHHDGDHDHDGGHGDGHGHGHNHGHHDGHHHNHGFDDDVFVGDYWGYDEDGDGYVETIPMADQFGYFATGGQVIQREGGRPTYNYDRGYPYEWFNGAPGGASDLANAAYGPRPGGMSCGLEGGIRVCRGW